jgi:phosphinothricin acetyltransferase
VAELVIRAAVRSDAARIAEVYSAGIADRVATFETEPRVEADVLPWFENGLPIVVVADGQRVVGYAAAFPYSDRCCYSGIVEFSVYVDREWRGKGVGRQAMAALIEACRRAGLHKLISRIFPENRASLKLMESLGFQTVGLHAKHGKLDGAWRDVVAVEFLIKENL